MKAGWPAALLVSAAALAAYLAAASVVVRKGAMNADEGFYACAASAVMHGRVPYRDFGYTQTPLGPYLQGAVLAAAGFGVRQLRWADAAFGALALGLAAGLWRRRGLGAAACLALAAAWCLGRGMVYYDTIGKTYAAGQLLLVGAALACGPSRRPVRALLLLSLLCTAAVGCRLTVAPCALVLWMGFAAMNPGRALRPWLLLAPLLWTTVLLVPFYAAAPEGAVFWTLVYHTRFAMPSDAAVALASSLGLAPAVSAAALLGLAHLLLSRGTGALSGRLRPGPGGRPAGAALEQGRWVLAAGCAGWLCSAGLSGVYAEYAVPCLPLVLTGFGLVLAAAGAAGRPGSSRALACALILSGLAAAGLWLGPSRLEGAYLGDLDQAVAFVRSHSGPGDTVLTSMPETALESGRRPYPGLELGKFGVTSEMAPEAAARLHLLHYRDLIGAVDRRAARLIVLYRRDDDFNFGWSVPSIRLFSPKTHRLLMDAVANHYAPVYGNDSFLIFQADRSP